MAAVNGAPSAQHTSFPDDLPRPVNDGAAKHLMGHPLPSLTPLQSTNGDEVDLFHLSLDKPILVFIYPRTGAPGENVPKEWDAIPGE